jgi:hypothetical protein
MPRTPYLIQRAVIQTPLAEPDTRLSQAVSLEYMGSAEFEFGALPQSLRRIQVQADSWVGRVVNEIKEDDSPLRVYSHFNDEEFEEYRAHLLRLRDPNGRVYLKEYSAFEEGHAQKYKYSRTNFWWDLDNDAMFGFHKEFMKRLPHLVAASLKLMDELKVIK